MKKLYVVARGDLQPGQILAQSCHAIAKFVFDYTLVADAWITESNIVVCLTAKNERHLSSLLRSCVSDESYVSEFYEPDFENSLTSFAALFVDDERHPLADLPLAFS